MEVGGEYFISNWRKTATMVWTCKENARKQTATDNFRIGTRGNAKKGRPKDRWLDWVRRSMTNHGLTEVDNLLDTETDGET
jgi:hypothetical protein